MASPSTDHVLGNCTTTPVSACSFKSEVPKKRAFLVAPSPIVTHSCPLRGGRLAIEDILSVSGQVVTVSVTTHSHMAIRSRYRSLINESMPRLALGHTMRRE